MNTVVWYAVRSGIGTGAHNIHTKTLIIIIMSIWLRPQNPKPSRGVDLRTMCMVKYTHVCSAGQAKAIGSEFTEEFTKPFGPTL